MDFYPWSDDPDCRLLALVIRATAIEAIATQFAMTGWKCEIVRWEMWRDNGLKDNGFEDNGFGDNGFEDNEPWNNRAIGTWRVWITIDTPTAGHCGRNTLIVSCGFCITDNGSCVCSSDDNDNEFQFIAGPTAGRIESTWASLMNEFMTALPPCGRGWIGYTTYDMLTFIWFGCILCS